MRKFIATLLILVSCSALVYSADTLLERLSRLQNKVRYDLALDIVEDEENRGRTLSPAETWFKIQLFTEPDKFEREAAAFASKQMQGDALRSITELARAKEHFARGRYQTAMQLLQALPPEDLLQQSEVNLFLAMSAQASGNFLLAREQYNSFEEGSELWPEARVLLAEMNLREGKYAEAKAAASDAYKVGKHSIGAQALYVLAKAEAALQQQSQSNEKRSSLLSLYPRSAEAAWLREAPAISREAVVGVSSADIIPEEDALPRRKSFALQFGAFRDRSLALRLASELKPQVQSLRIESDRTSDAIWYRVVGGNFPSRSGAESEKQKLSSSGIASLILSPGQGNR